VSHAVPTTNVDAVITDEARTWIGRSTELMPLPEEVTASDVRRYLEATGDHNPLWLDDDAARSVGYRGRVVPPMLVIDLVWRLKNTDAGRMTDRVPLPVNYIDTRNVETEIEWLAPVYIGDRISIRHRILDIVARPGRRGLGVHITRETEYVRLDGRLVARTLQTVARFPKAAVGTK
jgi:acyl dehydratase